MLNNLKSDNMNRTLHLSTSDFVLQSKGIYFNTKNFVNVKSKIADGSFAPGVSGRAAHLFVTRRPPSRGYLTFD